MKFRNASKRWICLFLTGLMLVMAPLCAYAREYGVASGSDAQPDPGSDPEVDAWIQQMAGMIAGEDPEEVVVDLDSLGEYDPLANLTEEQYEAYCQTFIDHPSVFLDYPEGMIRPRFAVTLSAAAVCGLCILAAAVGLVFTWNLSSWVNGYSGYDFFSGFEQYQRINHPEDTAFWSGWDAILGSSWGQVIFGVNPVYDAMKRYCKDEVKGYGTDESEYTVVSLGSGGLVQPNVEYGKGTLISTAVFDNTAPVYMYVGFRPDVPGVGIYCVSTGPFLLGSYAAIESGNYYTRSPFTSVGKENYDLAYSTYLAYLSYGCIDVSEYCGPGLDFIRDVVLQSGFVLGEGNVTISITPEKSIVDAQEKTFVSPGDTITLPADQTAADSLSGNISAATDAAAVAGALTGTWDLGDTQAGTDEEDPVLPWVPDITGWLEKLLHGIEAVPGEVAGEFSGFGEKVEALPGSIAQALENTLIGEDDGTYQISQIVTDKFPFCVPFDLVGCFRVLQAPATPPVWRIPFVVDNNFVQIHEEIVIDLSDWERPAAVIRFFVLLMFIFGLAYVTRYVVKG